MRVIALGTSSWTSAALNHEIFILEPCFEPKGSESIRKYQTIEVCMDYLEVNITLKDLKRS